MDNPGEEGGEWALGFHDTAPDFGRVGGPGTGAKDGFSKAAILSRREPGLGFGGVWSDISPTVLVSRNREVVVTDLCCWVGYWPNVLSHGNIYCGVENMN
jgi:hypothetical protein